MGSAPKGTPSLRSVRRSRRKDRAPPSARTHREPHEALTTWSAPANRSGASARVPASTGRASAGAISTRPTARESRIPTSSTQDRSSASPDERRHEDEHQGGDEAGGDPGPGPARAVREERLEPETRGAELRGAPDVPRRLRGRARRARDGGQGRLHPELAPEA